MILRRLCCLVALGALCFSSGCCHWRRHCCERPILFPRIRGAWCERGCPSCGCGDCGCSTCCHSGEFVGGHIAPIGPVGPMTPMPTTSEPAVAPLPMPRPAVMRSVN
jgi:hypothetical protein